MKPDILDRQDTTQTRNKRKESERPSEAAFYTIQQVADLLGISQRTVRRLIQRGALVAHRISTNIIRVDAASVTHLLETTRTVASPVSSCPRNESITPEELPTSFDSVDETRSGQRSSTGARSRSRRPTLSRPNVASSSWPTNAGELKEMVRRLRRPS